jgi:succinoglycan biosynthesis protein ExoA
MTAPLVTVVVPARDESSHLPACLAAIAAQDHSPARLEVIVVIDGATRDDSVDVAIDALRHTDYARTLVMINADGGRSGNLNLGLSRARGAVLCRVDARSVIPSDYVRRCAQLLAARPDIAVVGGAQVAIVPRHDAHGAGIARALNNRWGMGGSRYRRGAPSGPADTVYLGGFRTADLQMVGGWDSDLATNEDFDLNRRLRQRGVVWFEAGLPVEYVPRPTVGDLYRQYRRFGRWKVRYWRHTGDAPQGRQVALLAGVPAAALIAALALVFAPTPARVALLSVALATGAAIELAGSRRPRGGPAVHGWSVVTLGAVGAGWLGGVWTELLARGRHSRGRRRGFLLGALTRAPGPHVGAAATALGRTAVPESPAA